MLLLFVLLAAEPSKLRDDPPPPPPEELPLTPLQADLSVSFGIADKNPLAGALYVGGALGWAHEHRPAFFAGLGFELTYTAFADPYRISLGGQLRLGVAWARRHGRQSTALPDLLLFVRLTGFGGGNTGTTTNALGMTVMSSTTYFGVRAGLGLTSLWPARQFIEHDPLFDVDGLGGDVLRVLTTILLFPLALINHAEIAYELVLSPSPLNAVIFRVGAGF